MGTLVYQLLNNPGTISRRESRDKYIVWRSCRGRIIRIW